MLTIVDLREVYSNETYLSRPVVNIWKSLGIEMLYYLTEKYNPIGIETIIHNGRPVLECIDGHHKARALLEMGVKIWHVRHYGHCEDTLEEANRLSEVDVLELDEYKRRYQSEREEDILEDFSTFFVR